MVSVNEGKVLGIKGLHSLNHVILVQPVFLVKHPEKNFRPPKVDKSPTPKLLKKAVHPKETLPPSH